MFAGAIRLPCASELLHVLDKNRLFSSGKRMFLVLFAAVTFELLEEAI